MSAEQSQSPSRSSGLSQVLSKARRHRDRKTKDSASSSVFSKESDQHGVRASIEGAIEKLKGQDSADTNDGDSTGLAKLMPKGITMKQRRRKKQAKEDEERASEEAARGRSVAERGTLENDTGTSINGDADGSSLMTYDSEEES